MSSFLWPTGSEKQGAVRGKVSANSNAKSRTLMAAAPELPLRQATRSRLSPTDPLIHQRKAREAPSVPSSSLLGSSFSKGGKNAS
ncbi:unnamed protein product [Sphagnum jensenii]|uniref:Uncharacterized protein n=1 Tax=Sphagnum jensenii TaxID=128206 RepID=A0ABP1ADW1_9BRYO